MTQPAGPISVTELLRRRVEQQPSALALAFEQQHVTYEQLDVRVRQLVSSLSRRGVRPGDRVAVRAEPSLDAVVALLATVTLGATYVGLDKNWPADRVDRILQDSIPAVLIGDDDARGLFPDVLAANESECDAAAVEFTDRIRHDASSPVGLFYTSGSTGRPKGVLITAASVMNRLEWMWTGFPFQPHDVSILHTSPATISFPWNALGALLAGHPTVIAGLAGRSPAGFLRLAAAHSVTHASASPGFWNALLDELDHGRSEWRSLRIGRTGGEQLTEAFVRRWYRRFQPARLLNVYGATECSSSSVAEVVAEAGTPSRVPVGTPVANVRIHVLDDRLRPVPVEAAGDIYVGGASIALGYLNAAGSTATRFIADPLATGTVERLFRTGDVGRWRADGQLEVLGRRDEQVKIRGFRVELGEVDEALQACDGVTDVKVLAESDATGATRIVAHVAVNGTASRTAAAFRSQLLRTLPDFMIPSAFVIHHEPLPRTASGKVDRHKLRDGHAPEVERPSAEATSRTTTEEAIAQAWCKALHGIDVGLDDNFFDLGGHSLTAMAIVTAINATLETQLTVSAVFEQPTVRALAAFLERDRKRGVDTSLKG